MIIKQIPVLGVIETNAYFYIDEASKHGFLIDPGAEAEKLLQTIKENDWIIEKILITHGHFDHIGAVAELAAKLSVPYFAHQNGKKYLTDAMNNLSAYMAEPLELIKAEYFADNAEFLISANPLLKLKAIHTPGHTQDAVIYYDAENHLAFVGDTIFKNSIGATHFPGGDLEQLLQSIKKNILTLPDNTVLYSGHSEPTTVKAEKANFI